MAGRCVASRADGQIIPLGITGNAAVRATVLRKDRRLSFPSFSEVRLLITGSSLGAQHSVLARAAQWLFGSLLVLQLATSSSLLAAKFVDAMVAQVDLFTIAASDVALARALRLYGLKPGSGMIRAADVERFIDARLIVAEAERLDIAPPPEALEKAWREVVVRRGGTKRFRDWLAEKGISEEWARRLTHSDARRKHFAELRFERFVFIPEEDITRALGSGPDNARERERVREALRQKQAERQLELWLEEQRKRVEIRRFTDEEIPDPLASAGADNRRS